MIEIKKNEGAELDRDRQLLVDGVLVQMGYTTCQAPKARNAKAWGNAPGKAPKDRLSSEGAK
jgi:hypothetical protein